MLVKLRIYCLKSLARNDIEEQDRFLSNLLSLAPLYPVPWHPTVQWIPYQIYAFFSKKGNGNVFKLSMLWESIRYHFAKSLLYSLREILMVFLFKHFTGVWRFPWNTTVFYQTLASRPTSWTSTSSRKTYACCRFLPRRLAHLSSSYHPRSVHV